jgi:putative RNA 2'-phosphotransferase
VDQPIQYQASTPPAILYHGTTAQAVELILAEGLRSMNRQYVHLSANPELAQLVGGRRTPKPAILIIDARKAAAAGHRFFQVDDDVWLSEAIPADYIQTHPR